MPAYIYGPITTVPPVFSFNNYIFSNPAISTNSFTYVLTSSINTGVPYWNAVRSAGGNFAIGNGTGGGFAFLTCPYQQFLIFQGNGISISQTLTLLSGTYILNMYIAVRPNLYVISHQIYVYMNNNLIYTSSLDTTSTNWTNYTSTFTVTTNNYLFKFIANNATSDSSIGLTNIILTKIG